MKRGNRNNIYERGGQVELAKAMGNVARKGDKEINEGREEIKSIRKDITSSENQINNLESGIDREKKSIKDRENNIKEIKKDLGGIYKTVQDAKKQKVKFADGGKVSDNDRGETVMVIEDNVVGDLVGVDGNTAFVDFSDYGKRPSSGKKREYFDVSELKVVKYDWDKDKYYAEGGEVGKTYEIKGADVAFYEDSYEEGEQDQFHSYYLGENDFPYKTKFSNKKDLFETLNDFVSYADMKEEDFYVDEDTIQTSALVKHEKGSDWDEFSAPTEKEKELWKKGEMKLYSAQFVFPYEVYKKEKLEFAKGGKIDNTIHPYLLQQKVGKQLKTIKGLTEDEERKITDKMLDENNQQVSGNINYGIDKDPNYFAKGGMITEESNYDIIANVKKEQGESDFYYALYDKLVAYGERPKIAFSEMKEVFANYDENMSDYIDLPFAKGGKAEDDFPDEESIIRNFFDGDRKKYEEYQKEEERRKNEPLPFEKGGEVKRKKGQLSVSDTKKYWGYSDKEWEDLSDYEKNKAKTQAKVDKDNKYAEKMDNSSTKKENNELLIGGLAGILIGIFLGRR